MKKVVVSGIRPTGFLHLGNYFGALKNFLALQEDYECFFFIADWHALTTHPNTTHLRAQSIRVAAEYLAAGLSPEKVALYLQSDLRETAELYFYLNTLAFLGELEKTPTFKEKARKQADNVNAALLTYPVLMSADILLHRAQWVPVGKDQEQHLEVCRNWAVRFNKRYHTLEEDFFPLPQAFNFDKNLVKIQSLDGNGKMSKSENENATIYLSDSDEAIRKKIMKARTDSGPTEYGSISPYIENLFTLLQLVAPSSIYEQERNAYKAGSLRYGTFKTILADYMIAFISPLRERTEELIKDPHYIEKVLSEGAAKARASAQKTLTDLRKLLSFNT